MESQIAVRFVHPQLPSNKGGIMDVREWKEKTRKSFTLKSGLDVCVRRLSPFALAKLGPIPKLEDIPPDRNLDVAEAIVRAGLLSPKVGDGEGDLAMLDLTLDEINEITEAILNLTRRPDDSPLAPGEESSPVPQPS
jgi:hypothetical protein